MKQGRNGELLGSVPMKAAANNHVGIAQMSSPRRATL
jgi:hypothetical protein